MRTLIKRLPSLLGWALLCGVFGINAQAATNQATDPGGGGVGLTDSGNVTVNSTTLVLRKLVFDTSNNCLASDYGDAACNGGATSAAVPAGTTVNFLIYVDNSTDSQADDIQIVDALDETASGFSYVDNSLTWNNNSTNTGTALATIYTDAAGTALTDLESGADIASAVDTGASPAGRDDISVGDSAGGNATANITDGKIFALRFQAVKK